SAFDVDHAKTIFEHGIDAIKPDNLQILFSYANRSKNKTSAERVSFTRQKDHIITTIESHRFNNPLSTIERKTLIRTLNILEMIY
ncbi:MAG: hypothetical protein ACRC47_09085, partial [Shewanella sp.]